MAKIQILFAVGALVHAAFQKQLDRPIPPSLEEVFGPVLAKSDISYDNWAERHHHIERSDGYYKLRAPENCKFPLDILLVIDATGSTGDNRDQFITDEIPKLVKHLEETHPRSRVGVMSFKDKPIPTLGETFDYCHRLDMPLQPTNLTELQQALWTLWPNGGQDPAENQFGALYKGLLGGKEVGWEDNDHTRLVLLLTDSWPHFADDGLNNYGLTPWEPQADDNTHCTVNYYPNPSDIYSALDKTETYLLTVVYDAEWYNKQPINSWIWLNKFVQQPREFVRNAKLDASDWWVQVSEMVRIMRDVECDIDDTTTAEPTPSSTTTSAPTTSTTENSDCTTKCPPPEVLIKLQDEPRRFELRIDN